MVEIMVFLTEAFLLTVESSWIIKNFIFCLDKYLLTFLLYSLGIDSKIRSIMERKKSEKIATVSLQNMTKINQIFTCFFVLLQQLNN